MHTAKIVLLLFLILLGPLGWIMLGLFFAARFAYWVITDPQLSLFQKVLIFEIIQPSGLWDDQRYH